MEPSGTAARGERGTGQGHTGGPPGMSTDKPFRVGRFLLTEEEVRKRKAFLEIQPEDEERLRRIHPLISQHVSEIVEKFYDFLVSHEPTREMLAAPGLVDRLKQIQIQYFKELTAGRYDYEYFRNRLRVGLAHYRFGLSPEWYLGAYQKYLALVARLLQETIGQNRPEFVRTLASLTKVVFMDMSLAIDTYILSAQEQLSQKAAALEAANAELHRLDSAKRHLTGAIVHDLQNPLAGIIAFLQVLENRPQGLTDVERRSLGEALARCNDLSTLILDVLQMNRAEEGKLDLYMESIDLTEIGRAAVEAFALVAEQGGRHLAFVGSNGPVIVRTDQSLLRRLLYNLIRNALQHTPAGTRVKVDVRAGPPWTVRVADNGPGIPLEIQDRIFEPGALRSAGFQVESGLGLVFSKMAAGSLGINLRLVSEPGQGACFLLEQGPKEIGAESK